MLKIEETEVVGWKAAIRGMRNPMNSWEQSDSGHCQRDLARDCTTCVHRDTGYSACTAGHFDVGPRDYDLMTRLRNAGTDHRKFMRMLIVYLDITAPLYWWKEYDTYKVGTVANSCSTMHKIAAKEFTLDDFSHEHLGVLIPAELNDGEEVFQNLWIESLKRTIEDLNIARGFYIREQNSDLKKKYWLQMIQLLPSSYNQKRTIMLNYEVLANIYKSRRNHKLDEWHTFCNWIEGLPYSDLITGGAASPNKKITVSEADAIASCALSKLQNSEPTKEVTITDLTITDWWNQCGHMDYIPSVKSNCDIVTDTIGKLQKKFWSQEKGDTSDAKPE